MQKKREGGEMEMRKEERKGERGFRIEERGQKGGNFSVDPPTACSTTPYVLQEY